jgi:hypothetical protein
MTHPITPPEELVASMIEQAFNPLGATGLSDMDQLTGAFADLVTRAAQWGADQQLAEDAKWLDHNALNEPHLRITPVGESLKEAMRPKPPSLKEQALVLLNAVEVSDDSCSSWDFDTIRRALEKLPDN